MDPESERTYGTWQSYCLEVLREDRLDSFKPDPRIEYMTEHDSLTTYVTGWASGIKALQKKYNISDYLILDLIYQNERVGGAKKNTNYMGLLCNANSVKYCLFALQTYDLLRKEDWEGGVSIIETGGGYGGYMLILWTLLRYVGFPAKEYIMIDIDGVIQLQEAYLKRNGITGVQFIPFHRLHQYRWNPNQRHFLFSSYSLSEVPPHVRKEYYERLFPFVFHGMLYWNNPEIDLPDCFSWHWEEEVPETGPHNKIVYFRR